jgi:hypothetical protein
MPNSDQGVLRDVVRIRIRYNLQELKQGARVTIVLNQRNLIIHFLNLLLDRKSPQKAIISLLRNRWLIFSSLKLPKFVVEQIVPVKIEIRVRDFYIEAVENMPDSYRCSPFE